MPTKSSLCGQGRWQQGDTRNHPPTVFPLQAIGRTRPPSPVILATSVGGVGPGALFRTRLADYPCRPNRRDQTARGPKRLRVAARPVRPSRLSLRTGACARSALRACSAGQRLGYGTFDSRGLTAISCRVCRQRQRDMQRQISPRQARGKRKTS